MKLRSLPIWAIGKAVNRFAPGWRAVAADKRGASAVEFAIVAPIMLAVMLGSFKFSIAIYNYISVANAVSVGARSFAMARASAVTTPYTTTVATMKSALPSTMTQDSLVVTLAVGAAAGSTTYTSCTTDTACNTALSSAAGYPVKITASYPSTLSLSVTTTLSFSYTLSLTSSTVGRVE